MATMSRRALLQRLLPGRPAEPESRPRAEPRFVIRVVRERCITFRGPECGACAGLCPDGDQALVMRRNRPEFAAESCQGCGLCVSACPMAALAMQPHIPAA